MTTIGNRQSSLVVLVVAVALGGLGVIVGAALGRNNADFVPLLALGGLAIISELVDFSPFPHTRVSLSVALIMAAGMLSGMLGVAVVVSVAMAADFAFHPKPVFKGVFNEGALLLAGAAFVGIFQAFSAGYRPEDWPAALVPILLGSIIAFAVNSSLVALAISLHTGRHPFSVWNSSLRWLFPHYVLLGVLAGMMVAAYVSWELAGMALILVPLAMVWLALKRYADSAPQLDSDFQDA